VFRDPNSAFAECARKFQDTFGGWKALKIILLLFYPKILNTLRIPLIDKEALAFFKCTVEETIKHRKATGEKRDDFIQLLMEAQAGGAEGAAHETEKLDNFEKDALLAGSASPAKTSPLTDEIILSQSLLFFSAGSE
jgi:hypothetical protein